jgi:hypothetical protein
MEQKPDLAAARHPPHSSLRNAMPSADFAHLIKKLTGHDSSLAAGYSLVDLDFKNRPSETSLP